MQIILRAFHNRLQGIIDMPSMKELLPDIYVAFPNDYNQLDIYDAKTDHKDLMFDPNSSTHGKARFQYTGEMEHHFQYGELPVYKLKGVEL